MLRTRAALRGALLELVQERGWDDIDVRRICARADVGRSTFYNHFADPEDLLVSGFDELRRALAHLPTPPAASGPALRFTGPLLQHAGEHRALFRALVGKRSGEVVRARFRDLVLERTAAELSARGPARAQAPLVRFLAGAFVDLAAWWIDAAPAPGAAELDALYQSLARAAVAAYDARRPSRRFR